MHHMIADLDICLFSMLSAMATAQPVINYYSYKHILTASHNAYWRSLSLEKPVVNR